MRSIVARIRLKLEQMIAFATSTKTPVTLILDTLKLKRCSFVAVSHDNIKICLQAGAGESFTFFENLVRRDYLSDAISLDRGDTVVDVGANIGSFTVLAASIVGPHGRVLAFEPVPQVADRLRANVALNRFSNVTCIQAAIDGKEGKLKISVMGKSAHSSAHLGLKGGNNIEVPMMTLEAALQGAGINRVNLLKIDCEGSEYGIFQTMTPTMAGAIDQIAIEVHDVTGQSSDALQERIRELGFELHHRAPCWFAFNRRRLGLLRKDPQAR